MRQNRHSCFFSLWGKIDTALPFIGGLGGGQNLGGVTGFLRLAWVGP